MKVAFHFDEGHKNFQGEDGLHAWETVLNIIAKKAEADVFSKIYVGSLLFLNIASDVKTKRLKTGNQYTQTVNPDKFERALAGWLSPGVTIWQHFSENIIDVAIGSTLHAMCFDSLDQVTAEYLHTRLQKFPSYMGAMEIYDGSAVHWALYSASLIPKFRVHGADVRLFTRSLEADRDEGLFRWLSDLKFKSVAWEDLGFRHSIFDAYDNFDHARRIAEWKARFGATLAFVADRVVSQLSDPIPDFGARLWAALSTFQSAETPEQLAQVTASCRRIVEQVADKLFPPRADDEKLGTGKYRNRLLAYADESRRSDTNIDLVVISTKTLSEQLEKLAALANKGVHADVYRDEVRRCLVRTVLLLDDLISLRNKPFDISTKVDADLMRKVFGGEKVGKG